MSDTNSWPAATAAGSRQCEFEKVPRERTAILAVETELCPQTLMRVLGIVAARGVIPFTIAARRDDRFQAIEIEIDMPDEHRGLVLLQNLRRIITVRRASLIAAADSAQRVKPIAAKA